jgi:L-threonylcarbamoyladenylate synthase
MTAFTPDSAHLSQQIEHAAQLLANGQLVAFPTETVYGLGADASNPAAVAAIYRAKGRPMNHPVIVHLAPGADPYAWTARLSPAAQQLSRRLIERFWPGPLTLILPRAAHVPDAVTGGQDSVGLRCPSHPVAQALLQSFSALAGHPTLHGVAAPSANRFGRISPTSAQHVRDEFAVAIDADVGTAGVALFVLDGGACSVGIESTILDLSRVERSGPVLLRPGGVTASMLAEVIGAMPACSADADQAAPRASGTLAAHYAPRTPLRLVTAAELLSAGNDVAVWTRTLKPLHPFNPNWLSAPLNAVDYAHALYARLRQLDHMGKQLILVETPPDTEAWAAVRDRLQRAAAAHL